MITEKEKAVLNLFLRAAKEASDTNFRKLKALSVDLDINAGPNDEFADQVFRMSLNNLISLIEAMR